MDNYQIDLSFVFIDETIDFVQHFNSDIQKNLNISTTISKEKAPANSMGIDTVLLITASQLAINVLTLVFTILKHHKRETLTIEGDNYNRVITNLSKSEVEKIIRDLERQKINNLILRIGDDHARKQ